MLYYKCCRKKLPNGHIHMPKSIEEIDAEVELLLTVIFKDLETFDIKVVPTRWRVDLEKVKLFYQKAFADGQQAEKDRLRVEIEKMKKNIQRFDLGCDSHQVFTQALDSILKII